MMNASLKGKLLASRVYPEFFTLDDRDAILHAGCGVGAQVLVYGNKGGRIVCSDVQKERVEQTMANAKEAGIENIEGAVADLETLPFSESTFDKIVAVDIIQHVRNPKNIFAEFRRVLKPGGEALITYPAFQHWLLTELSDRKHHRRRFAQGGEWHPDTFNHNLTITAWLHIGARSGMDLIRSHATTLFPPLHRYGIPRFWFSNNVIHYIDYFFGGLPLVKRCGQAMMCVYKKAS